MFIYFREWVVFSCCYQNFDSKYLDSCSKNQDLPPFMFSVFKKNNLKIYS